MTENQIKFVKDYYSTYKADDKISNLNRFLIQKIMSYNPASVFEFGCGTGKILDRIRKAYSPSIARIGIDISEVNVNTAKLKGRGKFVLLGDETRLEEFVDWDVCFTCSVLDHIPDKKQLRFIIDNLKRIAKTAVVICETTDSPGKYYFTHDYESFGFKKTNIEYQSEKTKKGGGAVYSIWVWEK